MFKALVLNNGELQELLIKAMTYTAVLEFLAEGGIEDQDILKIKRSVRKVK